MGHKVNPIGMRLQVNRTWDSRWYADTKDYGDLLLEDSRSASSSRKSASRPASPKIIIERPHKKCRVTIHTARPGVIIGKKGADIEVLRKKLAAMTDSELHLNIVEVRKPELDAQLVAESIAQQLERRVSFRRAMKRAVQNAMRMGALGHPGERRGPSRRRRDRPDRMVSRGPRAAAHAARRYRLCHGRGQDALRHHRHQGLDLQRRDHGARSLGARPQGAGAPGRPGPAGAGGGRRDR
jgi:small subunit ribosomal protein S3